MKRYSSFSKVGGRIVTMARVDQPPTVEQRYLPFGNARLDALSQTDFSYTGQRALEAVGLMDYNARFYDAGLGRFTQPDSIVPEVGNPQALNRFTYVIGNPVRFVDPSGNKFCDEVDIAGNCIQLPGGLIGGSSQANGVSYTTVSGGSGGGDTRGGGEGPGNIERNLAGETGPAYLCLPADYGSQSCYVLMPTAPVSGMPPDDLTLALTGLGTVADVFEFLLAFSVPIMPVNHLLALGVSAADTVLTFGACYTAGECYLGSPGVGLPEMIVVNQDVVLTGAEFVIGVIPTVDIFTSLASAAYDASRMVGLPNYVSVGYSPFGPSGKSESLTGSFFIMFNP